MFADPLPVRRVFGFKQVLRSNQHGRGAEAALQRVTFPKGRLKVGYFAGVRQALDGLHGRLVRLHREHQAGTDDLAVMRDVQAPHTPCSHPTWVPVSSMLFPQKIGKIDPRRNQRFDALAVDLERNGMRRRHAGFQV